MLTCFFRMVSIVFFTKFPFTGKIEDTENAGKGMSAYDEFASRNPLRNH
jgi:hypothetical protein